MSASALDLLPAGPPGPVVEKGDFAFAAVHLDHPHVHGQAQGLVDAGAELRSVYDPDPERVRAFLQRFPGTPVAADLGQVLGDPDVRLVAAAAVPSERAALGIRVMEAGKDYFTDKAPFTRLQDLEAARAAVRRTGRKYMVYYSERLHVECAVAAGHLIRGGAIGRVVQVLGLGPHRLNAPSRPDWFFDKDRYGGILTDIGSHQIEQVLSYAGASGARITHARVANVHHPQHPELEDFGEAALVTDTGTSGYFRVDWFTPRGLSTWGDGRTFVLGTDGYIEMRKYVDVARSRTGEHLLLVTHDGEEHLELAGRIGFPFFGQLILDCLHRTEHAMTQEHAFLAAELCLRAQELADRAARDATT